MTDVYSEYRRKSTVREDPRLVRRDRDAKSHDKPPSPKSKARPPSPSPKPNESIPLNTDNMWHTQAAQYNTNMQTAYQHLGPSVYGDPNQYSNQGYATNYGGYQQGYGGYNPYQGYPQQGAYTSGNLQPGPPGEEYPQNEWAPVNAGYTQMSAAPQPAPVMQQQPPPIASKVESNHKKDAVAQELKQQKATMAKQREHYVQKLGVMRKELEFLVNQKEELVSENSSEHDNSHILRENSKLQVEIQNKMKTVYDVIEMLTKIIGDNRTISELEEMYYDEGRKHRSRSDKYKSGSGGGGSYGSDKSGGDDGKYCYIYYDPELHWCRICDVFPKSAKEYLLHLHSKEHRQLTQETDMVDTPWHRLPPEPEMPSHEGGAKKRIPIKGLQFLISSSAWYCKLCDVWVGDLHCASQHLKSQIHNVNYGNFIKMNPHWEIEWLRDRDKAFVRISKVKHSNSEDSDESDEGSNKRHKKRKDKASPSKREKKKKKQKKRKKHSSESSSSSSDSDSTSDEEKNEGNEDKSKSIRVAMRNKIKMQAEMMLNEESGGKWEVLGRLVEEHKRKEANSAVSTNIKEDTGEDHIINQWMTVSEPPDKDKKLFDDLKDRMKQKQDAEKQRLAELERKRLEKERHERELKEKEEQEMRTREEEKKRLQEEMERQKEREREAIRFKPRDKNSKRSTSPDRGHMRRSRSKSRHRDRSPHYNGDSHGRRHSPSYDRKERSRRDDRDSDRRDKSYKKPHFIGRMPSLFKYKKNDDKVEKEIKKEDYDIPRQSRFQPGNLARAFIPEPEVVCFPKLSSIPPLMIPPPAPIVQPPEPPKITSPEVPKAPPAPKINNKEKKNKMDENKKEEKKELAPPLGEDKPIPLPPPPPMGLGEPQSAVDDNNVINDTLQSDYQDAINMMYSDPTQMGMDPNAMMHYQYGMDYNNLMYSHLYEYPQEVTEESSIAPPPPETVPVEHTMPLQPPPLPPDDPNEDLAMLGISADDMAAQMI